MPEFPPQSIDKVASSKVLSSPAIGTIIIIPFLLNALVDIKQSLAFSRWFYSFYAGSKCFTV